MKEYMSQKKAGVFTKYLIDGASVLIERVSVKEGLWLMFEAELSSIYRSTSTSTIASSSFTSVVRVRTTTTCTPSAAIRTLR